jgi:hypothetical protein
MSNGSELKSRGAMALRAAGYKPCPRWWLTEEQLELVAYMAAQNSDAVNQIRAEASRPSALSNEERKAAQMEAAWDMQREWMTGKENT